MNCQAFHRFATTAMAFAAVLLLAGCESGPEATDSNIPPPFFPALPKASGAAPVDNSIKVGDTLEIFVEEDPSFDGIYRVREGGDIIMSGVGRIPVAGMSVSAAKIKIEGVLQSKQLRKATIIVDRVSHGGEVKSNTTTATGSQLPDAGKITVFMTGSVNRPGQHTLALTGGRSIGIYEAILIAGGVSRFGDDQKVHVLRAASDGRKHKIPVNIRLIEKGESPDPPIGHGDIVVVPEKVFGF